jgi:hypothetical protein
MLMDDPYGFSFRLAYSIDGLNEASSLEDKLNFLYTIPNYRNEYNSKLYKKRQEMGENGPFVVPHDLEEGVKKYQIAEEDEVAKADRKAICNKCSCDDQPFESWVRVENGEPVMMCDHAALECQFPMWDFWFERFQNRNFIF